MNLKIVCFGKLDQKSLAEAFNFYATKVQKKVNLEVIELKEQYQAEDKTNLQQNSKVLAEKLATFPDYQIVLLDVQSPLVDSLQFSQLLEKNKDFLGAKLIFVIGPSDGFSPELLTKYSKISFGKITYPHQLFRVVLIEQIYRALKIINHEKYHK